MPEAGWPALAAALVATGDPGVIAEFETSAPEAALAGLQEAIDDAFEAADLAALAARLETSDWGHGVLRTLRRQSPLSMACTLELVRGSPPRPGHREGAGAASTASRRGRRAMAICSRVSAPR